MNIKFSYIPIAIALMASVAGAQYNVRIIPLNSLSGFDFGGSVNTFRFIELDRDHSTTDTSTHILIDGLLPVNNQVSALQGNYRSINRGSGAIPDVGVVMIDGVASGTAGLPAMYSPIVGIVPRSGGWEDYSPVAASGTTVGDFSGSGQVSAGNLELDLADGVQNLTGAIGVHAHNTDSMELNAFTLNIGGGMSYSFADTVLLRDGERYYGTIHSTQNVPYESLVFGLELTGASPGPINLMVGEWIENSYLGRLYGASPDWAYSDFMGWVYTTEFPWMYHDKTGWTAWVLGSAQTRLWLYSMNKTWLFVEHPRNGSYHAASENWQQSDF